MRWHFSHTVLFFFSSVTLISDWDWISEIGVSSSIVLYIVRIGHTPRTRNLQCAAVQKLWEIKNVLFMSKNSRHTLVFRISCGKSSKSEVWFFGAQAQQIWKL